LAKIRVDVGLYRRVAEVEALGDLSVAQPRREEGDHLDLAGGEPIGRFVAGGGRVRGRRRADDRGHEAFLDGGVEMGLAGADRGFDLLGAGVLGQVAPRRPGAGPDQLRGSGHDLPAKVQGRNGGWPAVMEEDSHGAP
jgi:hypothetical protein